MNTPLKPRIARRSLPCAALIILVLTPSALLPEARGALDPAPDGGYPGYNTAIGFQSLYSVTTAYGNVATGWQALYSNKVGAHNSATGAEALYTNTADFNTATGSRSLYTNSTGTSNTASGYATLYNNTIGSYNTALGTGALTYNSSGSKNVAIGSNAGANLTSGGNNIVIGAGVLGKAADASVTRIGNTSQKKTFIGGIYNKTVASGVGVIVNSNGQIGTVQSSARY